MPELPEVETIASDLKREGLIDEKIVKVSVNWPRSLATHSIVSFQKNLLNKSFIEVGRRAKYLVFNLDHGFTLMIHLRMSGRVSLCARDEVRSVHDHVIFHFKSGRDLRFHDTRKFGRCYLTQTPELILGHLGPEPLSPDFKFDSFFEGLQKTRRNIKALLLDQAFLAGLGNIYVDESLWDAQIHPERTASAIKKNEGRVLYRSIKKILKRGIKNLGTSLGKSDTNFYSVGNRRGRNQDQLKVFRRQGEACPRCGQEIMRIILGQRGTHFCPKCQK